MAGTFGTDIFRIPGCLSLLDGVCTAAGVIADCFLLVAVDVGFTLEGVGVAGAFVFVLPSAGKSSDCDAMASDNPEDLASACVSCFCIAWGVGVLLLWGPSETEAPASGVAGRGLLDTLRLGVNGTEVAVIREEDLGCESSPIG